MKVGETFIDVGSASTPHLWCICTEPNADDEVVVVSVTTVRPNVETTCVLQPGDHPFVRHESAAAYRFAELVSVRELLRLRGQQRHRRHADADSSLVQRIRAGALQSPMTPNKVKKAIRECRWEPSE